MLNWKRINPAVSRFSKWTKTHMCPFRWYVLKKNICVYWPPGIFFENKIVSVQVSCFFTEHNVHSDGVSCCLQKKMFTLMVWHVFLQKKCSPWWCVFCFRRKCSLWWCVMLFYRKTCSFWWCVMFFYGKNVHHDGVSCFLHKTWSLWWSVMFFYIKKC